MKYLKNILIPFVWGIVYAWIFFAFIINGRSIINKEVSLSALGGMGSFDIDKQLVKCFPFHQELFEVYGFVNSIEGKKVIALGNDRVIKNENGYLIGSNAKADVMYDEEQLIKLKGVCDNCNADFLYINYPAKLDNSDEWKIIGYKNPCKDDATQLIKKLDEKRIKTLNIRPLIYERWPDFYSAFYKTDHHWTSQAGFYAAQRIVNYLNDTFGYEMDSSLMDEKCWEHQYFREGWLGETGRSTSLTYSGLDDFVCIKPTFDTDISILHINGKEIKRGSFSSVLLDETVYCNEYGYYDSKSWHYSYIPYGTDSIIIHNNALPKGKRVFLIKDSYSQVVIPFLAMCCSDIILWDMRDVHQTKLSEFLSSKEIDVVIVAYMEGFVSAKRMFSFD